MRILGKTLLPYHVNAWSLVVAEEVYRQKDVYKERIETITEQRELLREQFEQLGLKVWPSATNFFDYLPTGQACQAFSGSF